MRASDFFARLGLVLIIISIGICIISLIIHRGDFSIFGTEDAIKLFIFDGILLVIVFVLAAINGVFDN